MEIQWNSQNMKDFKDFYSKNKDIKERTTWDPDPGRISETEEDPEDHKKITRILELVEDLKSACKSRANDDLTRGTLDSIGLSWCFAEVAARRHSSKDVGAMNSANGTRQQFMAIKPRIMELLVRRCCSRAPLGTFGPASRTCTK